jgi:hypothetical protein
MTEDASIPRILWSMLRLIVAVTIVSPILFLAGVAALVGVGCDLAFHFIVRILCIDLEDP